MKKTVFIICLAILFNVSQAQNVNIPNANFLNALINLGVDTSGDHIIQNAEALAVTSLSIGQMSIPDIRGIEAFVNLTSLACPIDGISSVDLSKNTLLQYLDIGGNYGLKTLDLSKNINLTSLDIIFTGLTTIDLSHNLLLQSLSANGTVNSGAVLNNKLTSLDVSKNTLLSGLSADMNPSLPKICINADQFANKVAGWSKDANCVWDTACVTIPVTAINEMPIQNPSATILRAFDILGNELNPKSQANRGIIIYQYSDGTIKKVVRID
jgi:hypothetical protein